MDANKLKELKIRRGQLKAICTRAQTTLASDGIQTMPITQLRERKSKIEATWSQFDEVQSQIELLEESVELRDHEQARIEYEEIYFRIVSQFQDLILAKEAFNVELGQIQNTNHNQINNQFQAHTNNLRLPKIEL